ncbi:unnamed protein product [Trichogramma brassicae]|uniref:DUF7041 domain-containing protein n=1 Tax=Trichogramma brassicae TaxID=86971 RepID=A0A6H5IQZ6_9HYME|nr:unnamed protein product [Trichogramma brassicae]
MSRSSTVTIFRGIFLGGFLIFGVSPLSREGELRSPSPAEAPTASALASPRDSLAISCATAIPTSRLIVSVSTAIICGVNTPSVGTGGAPPPCTWSISISWFFACTPSEPVTSQTSDMPATSQAAMLVPSQASAMQVTSSVLAMQAATQAPLQTTMWQTAGQQPTFQPFEQSLSPQFTGHKGALPLAGNQPWGWQMRTVTTPDPSNVKPRPDLQVSVAQPQVLYTSAPQDTTLINSSSLAQQGPEQQSHIFCGFRSAVQAGMAQLSTQQGAGQQRYDFQQASQTGVTQTSMLQGHLQQPPTFQQAVYTGVRQTSTFQDLQQPPTFQLAAHTGVRQMSTRQDLQQPPTFQQAAHTGVRQMSTRQDLQQPPTFQLAAHTGVQQMSTRQDLQQPPTFQLAAHTGIRQSSMPHGDLQQNMAQQPYTLQSTEQQTMTNPSALQDSGPDALVSHPMAQLPEHQQLLLTGDNSALQLQQTFAQSTSAKHFAGYNLVSLNKRIDDLETLIRNFFSHSACRQTAVTSSTDKHETSSSFAPPNPTAMPFSASRPPCSSSNIEISSTAAFDPLTPCNAVAPLNAAALFTLTANNQASLNASSQTSTSNSSAAATVLPAVKQDSTDLINFTQLSQAPGTGSLNSQPLVIDSSLMTGNLNSRSLSAQRASLMAMPAFYQDNPTLWFDMLENEFWQGNVVLDQNKYFALLKSLGQLAKSLSPFIQTPQGRDDRYAQLKAHLLKKYLPTDEQKIVALFGNCKLSNRKPSEFFAELQGLAGTNMPAKTLLLFWYSQLPQSIALHLDEEIRRGDSTKAVEKADRMHDRLKSDPLHVAAFTSNSESTPIQSSLEVAAISQQRKSRSNRSSSPVEKPLRARSQSKPRFGPDKNLCYYHFHFLKDARRCTTPPCAWETLDPAVKALLNSKARV